MAAISKRFSNVQNGPSARRKILDSLTAKMVEYCGGRSHDYLEEIMKLIEIRREATEREVGKDDHLKSMIM